MPRERIAGRGGKKSTGEVKATPPVTPSKPSSRNGASSKGGSMPFKSPAKSPFANRSLRINSPHNNRVRSMRTREDLEQLAQQCIKLSQTGKISEKNAWELNLTTHLDDVLEFQKGDDDKTNFQVCSSFSILPRH